MNKICTSVKQSKKLIELGIDVKTADMYYMYRHWEIDEETVGSQSDASIGFNSDFYCGADNGKTYHYIPAWSLTALLELIPKHIKQEDGRTYTFHIFNDDGIVIKRWGCSYCAEDFHNRAEYLSDPHLKYPTNIYSDKYDNPLDAVFEMVCWLLENKKL